jgi:hypothetical protein
MTDAAGSITPEMIRGNEGAFWQALATTRNLGMSDAAIDAAIGPDEPAPTVPASPPQIEQEAIAEALGAVRRRQAAAEPASGAEDEPAPSPHPAAAGADRRPLYQATPPPASPPVFPAPVAPAMPPAAPSGPHPAAPAPAQADPAALAWLRDNAWFTADRKLAREAHAIEANLLEDDPYMTTETRLAIVRREVARRYPERFDNPARSLPPTVSMPMGQIARQPRPKAPTMADLDDDARAALAAIKRVDPKFKDETYLAGWKQRQEMEQATARMNWARE